MKGNIEIDFVVPWVDGSDPAWQEEFRKYSPESNGICDARFERYRDWDLMRYWFRGIEKNAPWVRKIFFITWRHIPEWLDVDHPKLVIVKHDDYIPTEYLPTFSSHPIELNMHRIKGLSEHFVYLNDDVFFIDKTGKTDFFVNDLPCDMAVESPIMERNLIFAGVLGTVNSVINRNFNKRHVIRSNVLGWFSPKYKTGLIKNALLAPWSSFSGMHFHHLAQPFLKSQIESVWEKEGALLNRTCLNKFRSQTDVNQYLFKFWQICSKTFTPTNTKKQGEYLLITEESVGSVCEKIKNRKHKMITLNDGVKRNFQQTRKQIANSLNTILTEESSFELKPSENVT